VRFSGPTISYFSDKHSEAVSACECAQWWLDLRKDSRSMQPHTASALYYLMPIYVCTGSLITVCVHGCEKICTILIRKLWVVNPLPGTTNTYIHVRILYCIYTVSIYTVCAVYMHILISACIVYTACGHMPIICLWLSLCRMWHCQMQTSCSPQAVQMGQAWYVTCIEYWSI